MLSAGKHQGQSKPDRAMWRFALLTCREADATSRVRNLMVIGAVVAGAFARILAPVVLGLGLEFALQGAWWRWGLPVVAVLYAAIWWLGSAGRACFLPTYGRLEQAMQSRFMVRALDRSNRSDPRARGRVDESTVGFAIDSAASALREGLSCLHLSLLPAGVSILAGTATVGLVGGIGVLAVFLATVLIYAATSTPLIRRHQRLQTLFFKEAMRSFGVLVNLLSLWRETRIFDGHAHARQWYRRDRSRVERRAMRSYRATRGLQVSQALVLAAGIAVALCLFARADEPPSLGVMIAVSGVFLSAVAPLQDAGFGLSTLAVSESQYREAQTRIDPPVDDAAGALGAAPEPPAWTPGRPVWCLGDSGAGKTTWAERFLGIRGLADGSLRTGPGRVGGFSYLPQEPGLLAGTVIDNVRFGRDLPPGAVDGILRELGLGEFSRGGAREHEVIAPERGGVSVGEGRRVALARAFADESSRIVVLDEPTAGMDANLRDRVWRIIESRAERCVVVVATHDPQAPIRDDDPAVTLPED